MKWPSEHLSHELCPEEEENEPLLLVVQEICPIAELALPSGQLLLVAQILRQTSQIHRTRI